MSDVEFDVDNHPDFRAVQESSYAECKRRGIVSMSAIEWRSGKEGKVRVIVSDPKLIGDSEAEARVCRVLFGA